MTVAFLGLSRKFHGHSSLKEYYEKESCVHYIHNVRAELPFHTLHLILSCFSLCSVCVCVCICLVFFLYVGLYFPDKGATAASELCR